MELQFSKRVLALSLLVVAPLAACSDDATTTTTTAAAAQTTVVAGGQAAVTKVSPTDGQALIESMGADLTIIDVRTPEEFAGGHLAGAVNLNLESGSFSTEIAALDHAAAYIVYCQSGRRSGLATTAMAGAGFTQVYDLGGLADWQAAGLPVVTT
ncbi:MAG: rhodanese-like domain-containing protein [Actinomycetota bacterium]|nr:rhodanese-like domain-containing protein [Actinomycetota bacterium]